jgi:GNAT superfamily N-acetyltransferase
VTRTIGPSAQAPSRRGGPTTGARGAVVVGPARPADLPALAALIAASPLLRRYRTTGAGARAALTRGRRAGDVLLVARASGGHPVGLAWLVTSRILTGAAYLRLLLLAADRQGAGLGARLLAAAEAEARRTANHLVLLVTTDNAGARRFYRRRGYHHVGDLPHFAQPDLDEALYHKALRPHRARLTV